MEMTEALKQLESHTAVWLLPVAITAVVSYVSVYLFYHFGPSSTLRDDSDAAQRRNSLDRKLANTGAR
jgi:hypothetical protein